jgi:glycine/D-amino acid oxidase-like deaminating enzyme
MATHPNSVWAATAHAAPDLPALDGDLATEVAIVGGGFTGLAAARDLLGAGTECLVLEAKDVAWGASGRTGGFAVPRFKKAYAALAREHGTETARHLHGLALEAIDTLEATVEDFGLDCDFARCGHLTAAHSESALAELEADTRWLAAEAGDRAPRILDRSAVASETGTALYRGGYLDPRGAVIQPLDYVRGLAAALAARGVPIYVSSPVQRLVEEPGAVVVETPGGTVRAGTVILATNAYSDTAPATGDLHRRIVPVASAAIATGPLSPGAVESILPARRAVSDTKHLLNYFRLLPGERLLFGGRGDITGRDESPSVYRGLERSLEKTFPQLAGTAIAHRWSGFVAVTLDHFPHIGRLKERVLYALGYGGRGVALSGLLGGYLAAMARGEPVDAGPMSHGHFGPIPFHGLRVPVLRLAAAYYGVRDVFRA